MHRIVLSGYYGFGNAGDEAMLQAIVTDLRALEPGLEVVVLSDDPARTARRHPVDAVDRQSFRAVAGALARADLLVSGGGSLLQDAGPEPKLFHFLGVIGLARSLLRPVVLYGHGVGPVRRRVGRVAVRAAVSRAALITVRDAASRDDLLAMGVRRPPIHVTADPVLSLGPELADGDAWPGKLADSLASLGLDPEARPLVGIFPREWPQAADFVPALARIADHVVTGMKGQVVLVPLEVPADVAVCRGVHAAMRRPERAGVLNLEDDYRAVLALVRRLDVALGVRLRALMFAAIAGLPMVGVGCHSKVDHFLEAVGQGPALPLERLEVEEACYRLETVWHRRAELGASVRAAVEELRRRARESARLTVAVLRGEPAYA